MRLSDDTIDLDKKLFFLSMRLDSYYKMDWYRDLFKNALENLVIINKEKNYISVKKFLDQVIPLYNDLVQMYELFKLLSGSEILALYFEIIRVSMKHVLTERLPEEHEFFFLHYIHETLLGGK